MYLCSILIYNAMSTQEKGKHGGVRPGSGRKPKEKKKVQMTVTVAEETKVTLKAEAQSRHTRPGIMIDDWVSNFNKED